MNITVLLEPIPNGFRASTGSPLNLTAEAPTADEAIAALRHSLTVREANGAKFVELSFSTISELRVLVAKLAANPLLDEWTAATKEYRRQREAEEDAEEAAQEALELGATVVTHNLRDFGRVPGLSAIDWSEPPAPPLPPPP